MPTTPRRPQPMCFAFMDDDIPDRVRPHFLAARKRGASATRRERVFLASWEIHRERSNRSWRALADRAGVSEAEAEAHAEALAAEGFWPAPRRRDSPRAVARRAEAERARSLAAHARDGTPRPSESRRMGRSRSVGVTVRRKGEREYAGAGE